MEFLRTAGRFIYGKVLPRRPYRILTGPLQGARFILGSLSGAGGGASVYFNQVEPGQTAAFCRELSPGDIFFDVGANVGYYSILASRLVGQNGIVAAFEPLVKNLVFLQRHIELNDALNIRIFPFAVSDSTGISGFAAGDDRAMGRLVDEGVARTTLVPTVTIDDITGSGLRPTVMKIDVEGAEIAVLNGARRVIEKYRPKIFLSTHSAELRESCLRLLSTAGYAVEPLTDGDAHEFLARPLNV